MWKRLTCDASLYRLTTTGETSEYFKKILLRDVFIMPFETIESQKKMSLPVKNTASWSLKEPLEEMSRFGHLLPVLGTKNRCFLRHPDNHQRHVSGRRLRAYHSVKDLLEMTLISR